MACFPRIPYRNPRQHTGKGYFERVELERRELQRQIAAEEQKRKAEQEAAAKRAAEEEARRKAAEEEARRKAAEEAAALAKAQAEAAALAEAKSQVEAAERKRKRQRGAGVWVRIEAPFGDAFVKSFNENTSCFAIVNDGYIIVNDNGGIAHWGIPPDLYND